MKWIKCSDRMPEYLQYDKIKTYDHDKCITEDVTHWMPLPEGPKEEEFGCDHLDYVCIMGLCPDNEDNADEVD